MYILVSNVLSFELHQRIQLISPDGTGKEIAISTADRLGADLAAAALKYNVNKIHLCGNAAYIQGIIQDFDTASNLMYSKNLIEIEVN